MFKSENIVVTNGTTHCKLKQSSKIVFFNSNTSIEFIKKVFCVTLFMKSKELHLLNSRRKNSLNTSLLVFYILIYIILIIHTICFMKVMSFIKFI